jgi:ABC-type ATPase with predicted acetyltransferase domain
VSDGLRQCYRKVLRPFEETSLFHSFATQPLEDADFDAKPMIMVVGQYSTGKTTFLRYLLGEDFPGMRIGPEPTTDRFTVITHGHERGIVPGNALAVDPSLQFKPLAKVSKILKHRTIFHKKCF